MADNTNTEREATYLCQAWGETDLPSAAIVTGLDGVRAFLVEQWLGDAEHAHDDGTKALPAAMDDMQEQWALEGKDWKWSIDFEIGGVSVQLVDDVGPGHASLAAKPLPAAVPVALADPLDALRWGANVAETLLSIGRSIGFGRAQQILGEQWEAEHNCAPRGQMGVTVGKCNPPKLWTKRSQDAYRRGWSDRAAIDEAPAAQKEGA